MLTGHELQINQAANSELNERRQCVLWNPNSAAEQLALAGALKEFGQTGKAQSVYLRALVLDPGSRPVIEGLRALGWSDATIAELKAAVVRDKSCAGDLTRSAGMVKEPEGRDGSRWITPDGLEMSFVEGAIRRRYVLVDAADFIGAELEQLPLGREKAAAIPLTALTDRLAEVRLGLVGVDGQPTIRYALQRHLNGPDMKVGLASIENKGVISAVILNINSLVIQGSRYFLRIWIDRMPEQPSAYWKTIPFSSESYFNTLAAETTVDSRWALPNPALLQPASEYRIGLLLNAALDADKYIQTVRYIFPRSEMRVRPLNGDIGTLLEWAADLHVCGIVGVTQSQVAQLYVPDLISSLNSHGVCTIYVRQVPKEGKGSQEIENVCHYCAEAYPDRDQTPAPPGRPIPLAFTWRANLGRDTHYLRSSFEDQTLPCIRSLRQAVWPLETLPVVVIAVALGHVGSPSPRYFEAIYRQDYPGKLRLVIIEDTPNSSAVAALNFILERLERAYPGRVELSRLRNSNYLEDCASRSRAIIEAEGDIYLAIDINSLIGSNFITSHVREHLVSPTNVVIGYTLEADEGTIADKLCAYEEGNSLLLTEPGVLGALKSFICPNYSINLKTFQAEEGFDCRFLQINESFNMHLADLELWYRLYSSGSYIRFAPNAIAFHKADNEQRQRAKEAKLFQALSKKYPEVPYLVVWWRATEDVGIGGSADTSNAKGIPAPDNSSDPRTSSTTGSRSRRLETEPKKLRILAYRWHVAHQYELFKLPHQFTLLTGTGSSITNQWDFRSRPLPQNVRMLPVERFDPREFDLAIVHFDENVLCPDLCAGVVARDWGRSFLWFLTNVELPKIAVCHGTPPFHGQCGANPLAIDEFDVIEEERLRLVTALRDCIVVCNSYQAADEWGFVRPKVIWHGIDPQEFPPGTHRGNVLSHGIDRQRPHYRGAHLLQRVKEVLGADLSIMDHRHEGARLVSPRERRYADRSFRAWVDHLRSFKVYLNTTLRSPMPRSRTEAMMCGVVPVTTRNHDVDYFILHGVNGFIADDAEELADCVRYVCRQYADCGDLARRARETALKIFNNHRFSGDWLNLLKEIGF